MTVKCSFERFFERLKHEKLPNMLRKPNFAKTKIVIVVWGGVGGGGWMRGGGYEKFFSLKQKLLPSIKLGLTKDEVGPSMWLKVKSFLKCPCSIHIQNIEMPAESLKSSVSA